MQNDLYNNVKSVVALNHQTINTDVDTVGVAVDTLGFESAIASVKTGAVTAGDVTISAVLESDDAGMAGATAIPANRLIGSASAVSTANTIDEIGFVADKRYVQVQVTTANTADLAVGANVILGDPATASVRG